VALCQATLRGCGEGAESTEPRLYVLSARRPPDSLAALLSGGDRKRAGPTAPPHGLVLLDEVFYLPGNADPRAPAEPSSESDDE
jgi:tRNA U38,U39,U40 pseudouridine synthase TruA